MIDEYYTWLIYGYHSDELSFRSGKHVVAVCDECGIYRSLPMDGYRDVCRMCAAEYRETMAMGTRLVPKEPLPDGWESKLSDITNNKESPVYLGSVAETILSRIYTDVQVMPPQNPGFDIICNRDFKIDIKSSALGDKRGYWVFGIRKNKIADFFLCLAFGSRDDLKNPVHLWLIPGNVINHLTGLKISKATIDKWSKYELPLDELIACCNTLHNDKERGN